MHGATRVFVIDIHPLVRDGLKARLLSANGIVISGEAGDLSEACVEPPGDSDIFLVDIDCMGSGVGGLAAFVQKVAPAAVLMLGWDAPATDIQRSMSAGAKGFMLKDSSTEELLLAVATLSGGGMYLGHNVDLQRTDEEDLGEVELSSREREVLLLVGQGFSSKAIAERLSLSVRTVESHRMNAKRKLGLRSNGELIKFAVESRRGDSKGNSPGP